MEISRRSFLGSALGAAAAAPFAGCCTCCCGRKAQVAVQLYSVRDYIAGKVNAGLAKTLSELAALGYKGVEFAGYYGHNPAELKKMLDDCGLVACGTHVGRDEFGPERIKATLDFNLGYGNTFVCCPGGGNMPPNCNWDGKGTVDDKTMDWMKKLVEFYNKAAETAAEYGCKIGLHNHEWEFKLQLQGGQSYWDYFFSNTNKLVQMEQDVGWTTCAGFDPCEQYKKYPHRSVTLHAKENGMGSKGKFTAVLGQPGEGARGVDWDRLFPVTDADGVEWYVVECEEQCNTLNAVRDSIAFLKGKGRC